MSSIISKNTINAPKIAVIGCGIFGAMAALRLAESGADVSIYERAQSALLGASFNNQNRLHLGFHYPRDEETARQCIKGFQQFRNEFGACLKQDFPNAYFIANNDSMTTPKDYLSFCERVGLRYDIIDLEAFQPDVRDVALGVTTDEVVYDCGVLRSLVQQRLDNAGVKLHFSTEISGISREGSSYILKAGGKLLGSFDSVVNCTYANINMLNSQLGHPVPIYQYEYTMVPIIEWDQPPVGVTIMDGRFMTVLPFGQTGRFLLYHVLHTVVATELGTQMPAGWLDQQLSPSKMINAEKLFNAMKKACVQYVPALGSARLVGYLQGPRVVLAHRDNTDTRPSIINSHEPGYLSVFTGKIDHCMWVADEITKMLCLK